MPLFLSGKYEVVWLIEIAAYCAVNCYALISGYVGIHGKYRYSNWVLLWLRVLFYSILITVFFKFAAPSVVGRYEWTSAIFPTSREQYWYFTAYTGLFLLIPVLNFFISHASRKQLKLVVMLGIVLYSVLPELFRRDIFCYERGIQSNLDDRFVYYWRLSWKIPGMEEKIKTTPWFYLYRMHSGNLVRKICD